MHNRLIRGEKLPHSFSQNCAPIVQPPYRSFRHSEFGLNLPFVAAGCAAPAPELVPALVLAVVAFAHYSANCAHVD